MSQGMTGNGIGERILDAAFHINFSEELMKHGISRVINGLNEAK